MKKKLIILATFISSILVAAEIKVDAGIAYNFRTLHTDSTYFSFQPKMPVYLNLTFNPTEINLKGNFNIENKEIDGLFKANTTFTGFAVDGNVRFLSEKLIGGLKIGANLDIIANKGSKFKKNESGDMILEVGPVYSFGKHNVGLLGFYMSNQLINPQVAGGTLTTTLFNDIYLAATVGYNLETLSKFKTTANLNNVDFNKEYTSTDKSSDVYFYGNGSSINKLVPIYSRFLVDGKNTVSDRVTVNYNASEVLKYTKFDGLLSKAKLDSSDSKNIMENKDYNDLEKRIKIAETLKLKSGKTDNNSVNYSEISSDFNLKTGVDVTIFENLISTTAFDINYEYTKSNINSNIDLNIYSNIVTFYKVEPSLVTSIKHTYDILQVDRLSLETIGSLYANGTILGGTRNKDYGVNKIRTSGKFNSADTSFISTVGASAKFAVRYGIFDTFYVKAGIGFGLDGMIYKTNGTTYSDYKGIYPEIFGKITYEW